MTASPSPSQKSGAWPPFLLPHPPLGQRFSPQDPQTRAAASPDRNEDSQAPPLDVGPEALGGLRSYIRFLSLPAQIEMYSETKNSTG